MHARVADRAEPACISRCRCKRCGLPPVSTATALRSESLSRFNGWPALPHVNASPPLLRTVMHDSGLMWFAIPFTTRFFHPLRLTGFGRPTETIGRERGFAELSIRRGLGGSFPSLPTQSRSARPQPALRALLHRLSTPEKMALSGIPSSRY
jgi:hypothetical protein